MSYSDLYAIVSNFSTWMIISVIILGVTIVITQLYSDANGLIFIMVLMAPIVLFFMTPSIVARYIIGFTIPLTALFLIEAWASGRIGPFSFFKVPLEKSSIYYCDELLVRKAEIELEIARLNARQTL